uniref:Uncharacterized protein n=1 Tax=Tanacetum cinerariifolium TaxID=118510 RepID=A0A6L2N003_TANCI|nr:hypothetical protein [Tanacetum cinerariifolium]
MVERYTHGTMRGMRKKSDGKVLDDALPLGRANGSRFMGMTRKEMEEEGGFYSKEMEFEVTPIRIDLVKMFLFGRNPFSYAVTNVVTDCSYLGLRMKSRLSLKNNMPLRDKTIIALINKPAFYRIIHG